MEAKAFLDAVPQLRGQWRTGFAGVTGLDFDAALAHLGRLGHDTAVAALFLPFWEDGALQAFAEIKDKDAG